MYGDAPPPPTHYKPKYDYVLPTSFGASVIGKNVDINEEYCERFLKTRANDATTICAKMIRTLYTSPDPAAMYAREAKFTRHDPFAHRTRRLCFSEERPPA